MAVSALWRLTQSKCFSACVACHGRYCSFHNGSAMLKLCESIPAILVSHGMLLSLHFLVSPISSRPLFLLCSDIHIVTFELPFLQQSLQVSDSCSDVRSLLAVVIYVMLNGRALVCGVHIMSITIRLRIFGGYQQPLHVEDNVLVTMIRDDPRCCRFWQIVGDRARDHLMS